MTTKINSKSRKFFMIENAEYIHIYKFAVPYIKPQFKKSDCNNMDVSPASAGGTGKREKVV